MSRECKELDDWYSCKSYIWNTTMFDCKSNKVYKTDEYLDIKNCFAKNVSLVN